ncbi:MAG: ABC-type methionine transport system ATPase subunit [Planctomycetota bacterium]|jgi:ABC-type methionine transport system ATPase subunit
MLAPEGRAIRCIIALPKFQAIYLMSLRKYFCTFPQNLIKEPIITYTLNAKFGVKPNIRAASITETVAMVAVEIEGELDKIDKAVEFLRERGVKVEEIQEDGTKA